MNPRQYKGTTPVGAQLLGRMIDPHGEPLDGLALDAVEQVQIDLAASAVDPYPDEALETGIKPIDFYAPIVRGGNITMIAGAGVGKVVASSEIVGNLATRRGGCGVIAALEDALFRRDDILADLRAGGVLDSFALVLGQPDDPAEVHWRAALAGLTIAEHFCGEGRETIFYLDEHLVRDDTVERLLARRRRAGAAALTLCVWQHHSDAAHASPALARLLHERDGQVVFNIGLGRRSIWPAIDPLRSTSRLLHGQAPPEQVEAVRAARDLLDRTALATRSLDDTPAARLLSERAQKVLLFQTQPFVVAEPFTAVPGVYVPRDEALRGFREILSGAHDALPVAAFKYRGGIDQVRLPLVELPGSRA